MDIVIRLRKETSPLMHDAAREIERLRAALKRIDGINDNPARYNPDIDAVIRGALEQMGNDDRSGR